MFFWLAVVVVSHELPTACHCMPCCLGAAIAFTACVDAPAQQQFPAEQLLHFATSRRCWLEQLPHLMLSKVHWLHTIIHSYCWDVLADELLLTVSDMS
jgi:hypothetical protein